jgi:hypothetical protein
MGRSRASGRCESVGRRLSISWRVSDCSCLCVASVLAACRRGRKRGGSTGSRNTTGEPCVRRGQGGAPPKHRRDAGRSHRHGHDAGAPAPAVRALLRRDRPRGVLGDPLRDALPLLPPRRLTCGAARSSPSPKAARGCCRVTTPPSAPSRPSPSPATRVESPPPCRTVVRRGRLRSSWSPAIRAVSGRTWSRPLRTTTSCAWPGGWARWWRRPRRALGRSARQQPRIFSLPP